MKKLTIAEKAQRYDEAIERGKRMFSEKELNYLFPELAKSEDEMIRKELIKFIKKRDRSGCDYDYDKWIAWLKKQESVEEIVARCY